MEEENIAIINTGGEMLDGGAVRAIVPKEWGTKLEMQVSDLAPNIFMFTFETVQDSRGSCL